jgi:hypothetical protein
MTGNQEKNCGPRGRPLNSGFGCISEGSGKANGWWVIWEYHIICQLEQEKQPSIAFTKQLPNLESGK